VELSLQHPEVNLVACSRWFDCGTPSVVVKDEAFLTGIHNGAIIVQQTKDEKLVLVLEDMCGDIFSHHSPLDRFLDGMHSKDMTIMEFEQEDLRMCWRGWGNPELCLYLFAGVYYLWPIPVSVQLWASTSTTMQAAPVGIHHANPRPARACGSFSFFGRGRDLYFIWTQLGHVAPTAARIRSTIIGTADISFHPCMIHQHNGVWHCTVIGGVLLAAVPHPAEFNIEMHNPPAAAPAPLAPILNTYVLIFWNSYTFNIANQPWERWRGQLQEWREALRAPTTMHNV
jgi:hypothetical protein